MDAKRIAQEAALAELAEGTVVHTIVQKPTVTRMWISCTSAVNFSSIKFEGMLQIDLPPEGSKWRETLRAASLELKNEVQAMVLKELDSIEAGQNAVAYHAMNQAKHGGKR